jgi:alpha-tubulin suppressor-like RCC1 family protein
VNSTISCIHSLLTLDDLYNKEMIVNICGGYQVFNYQQFQHKNLPEHLTSIKAIACGESHIVVLSDNDDLYVCGMY